MVDGTSLKTARSLSEGSYPVTVRVFDTLGAWTDTAFNVTVTRQAQTVAFTSAAPTGAAARVGSSYTPVVSSSSGRPVMVAASPASVCTLAAGTVLLIGEGTCSLTADQAGDAQYAPAAQATQTFAVSNQPQPVVVTPTQGTTAPETTLTKDPAKRLHKKRAVFKFSSNEAGAQFECSVDGAAFSPCRSAFSKAFRPGKHTFMVRAIDSAGNIDPSPATASWRFKPAT